MSIINDFAYWLEAGNNTGEDVNHKSISAYKNRTNRIREIYKRKRMMFLESVLSQVSNFETWHKQESEFLKEESTSKRDFDNTKAFLRAFWRFLKSRIATTATNNLPN
jgi:hypothetical protein